MSARGVRFVEIVAGTIVRHSVDQVGNNLTATLRWCETHVEPVWVYGDDSYDCPHDLVVGWNSDGEHRLTKFPAVAVAAARPTPEEPQS